MTRGHEVRRGTAESAVGVVLCGVRERGVLVQSWDQLW